MNKIFSPLELSAIGEVTNISLGSSATAISNMLDHRVDITTPSVTVVSAEEFELGKMEPAIGVEIKYVSGLKGSNIMILKMTDIKVIVDILMGTETPDEEFQLDELTLSAVCEVMNQMMGAASTALSDFLGKVVNISTPETFDLDDMDAFRRERLPAPEGPIVVVKFALDIEPDLKSEFMNVMSVELAKELVAGFGLDVAEEEAPAPVPEPAAPAASGGKLSQEEIEKLMSGAAAPAPAPEPAASGGKLSQEEIEKLMSGAAAPAPAPEPAASGGKLSQEEIEKLMSQQGAPQQAASMPGMPPQMGQMPGMPPQMGQMPGMPPQMGQMPQMPADMAQMPYPYYMPPYGWPGYPPPQPPEPQPQKQPHEPKVINTQAPTMPTLANGETLGEEQAQNLDLIMGVPLEVTVEIGRTRKKVQDILAFSKGSLVVLDKLAGDQVDLFVNGKCIARGEVVVIDDNFGIRISEILHKPELEDIAFK